jgi:formylglycine-generating enzyme required for sulfatase activity
MGTVRLSVNENNARTIFPTLEDDTFPSFRIIFLASDKDPPGETRCFEIESGGLPVFKDAPFPIPEGWYEKVEVYAFTENGCKLEKLGAVGENEEISGTKEFQVKSTDTDLKINILIDPFDVSSPKVQIKHGYFDWDIDNSVNNLTVGDTAKMTITPLTSGGTNDYKDSPINLLVNGFKSNIQLGTGIYNVSFEFGRTDHSFVKFSEILYIATGGAVSYYEYEIPALVSTNIKVYYNLNNPLSKNEPSLGWTIPVGSLFTSLPLPSFPSDNYEFDPTAVFIGWYNAAGTKKWNNYDRVLSGTTLYAKWEVTYEKSVDPPGIELKLIPAGTFTRGGNEVTLTKSFYMGKYEVTQDQYQVVMGINLSYFTPDNGRPSEAGETQGKRPVEYLSWFDAVEFCNKLSVNEGLYPVYTISSRNPASGYPITGATVTADWSKNGYRLPTEAEWEYACRAGTTTAYNTGSNEISDNTGWYQENSGDKTHEIGKKLANAWGLYDMHGNVLEWCWDWLEAYESGAQTNPVGPPSSSIGSRVVRGGAWNRNSGDIRSTARDYGYPSYRFAHVGFRIVRLYIPE